MTADRLEPVAHAEVLARHGLLFHAIDAPDARELAAALLEHADRLEPGPGWLVACDESYYPEVSEYDDEAGARHAFAELQARRLYGSGGYLARIVETTDGAPPQPPAPPTPGSVAEALTAPDVVRRRVAAVLQQQAAADRLTGILNGPDGSIARIGYGAPVRTGPSGARPHLELDTDGTTRALVDPNAGR